MAKLTSDKDLAMASQASCLRDFRAWILILAVGPASVPIVQGTEPGNSPSDLERFCNPPSGPARPCPPIGPVIAPRPVPPEVIEKMQKDLERAVREYQARPKTAPPIGILSGDMVQERFGAGYPFGVENAWAETLNGRAVTVYAGAMRYDPANDAVKYDPFTVHGFVILQKGKLGEPGASSSVVKTPTAVGSLRIVAADGMMLTLQSRQGNKFLLNVETEQLTPLDAQ